MSKLGAAFPLCRTRHSRDWPQPVYDGSLDVAPKPILLGTIISSCSRTCWNSGGLACLGISLSQPPISIEAFACQLAKGANRKSDFCCAVVIPKAPSKLERLPSCWRLCIFLKGRMLGWLLCAPELCPIPAVICWQPAITPDQFPNINGGTTDDSCVVFKPLFASLQAPDQFHN